jgi:hypothetical protein
MILTISPAVATPRALSDRAMRGMQRRSTEFSDAAKVRSPSPLEHRHH